MTTCHRLLHRWADGLLAHKQTILVWRGEDRRWRVEWHNTSVTVDTAAEAAAWVREFNGRS